MKYILACFSEYLGKNDLFDFLEFISDVQILFSNNSKTILPYGFLGARSLYLSDISGYTELQFCLFLCFLSFHCPSNPLQSFFSPRLAILYFILQPPCIHLQLFPRFIET